MLFNIVDIYRQGRTAVRGYFSDNLFYADSLNLFLGMSAISRPGFVLFPVLFIDVMDVVNGLKENQLGFKYNESLQNAVELGHYIF